MRFSRKKQKQKKTTKKRSWSPRAGGHGGGGLLGAGGPRADGACGGALPPLPVPLPSGAGRAGPRAARAAPELSVVLEPPRRGRQRAGGVGGTRRTSPGRGGGGMRDFLWALPPTPPPRGAYGHSPPPGISDSAPHLSGSRPLAPLFEPLGGEGTHPPSLSCAPPKQGPGGVMPPPPYTPTRPHPYPLACCGERGLCQRRPREPGGREPAVGRASPLLLCFTGE